MPETTREGDTSGSYQDPNCVGRGASEIRINSPGFVEEVGLTAGFNEWAGYNTRAGGKGRAPTRREKTH